MRSLCFAALLCIPASIFNSALSSSKAYCQSEWTATAGGWIPFLPDYRAGSVVGPGGVPVLRDSLFRDDMIDLGGQLKLRALHHFTGTKTYLEAHASIAGLETQSETKTIADGGPNESVWLASLDATEFINTPDAGSMRFDLDSDVMFTDQYIGLRDRFDLTDWGIGELFIGCGFHHMRFDQDFQFNARVSNGTSGLYREELDSTFLGGQIVSTLRRRVLGKVVMFDANLGFYDLSYRYDGRTRLFNNIGGLEHADRVRLRGNEGVTSLDLALRTDWVVSGVLMRPMIGMKYISDMPAIVHPNTTDFPVSPVTISTASSYFLNFGLEILL